MANITNNRLGLSSYYLEPAITTPGVGGNRGFSLFTDDGTNNPLIPMPGMTTGGNTPPSMLTMGTGGNTPPNMMTMNTGGNTPPLLMTMGTGGNTPPLVRTMNTGGNTPPMMQIANTGGNTPPLPLAGGTGGNTPPMARATSSTGGNTPPLSVRPTNPSTPLPPLEAGFTLPSINGNQFVANAVNNGVPGSQFSPVNTVQGIVEQLLSRSNPFVANARSRAAELANSRGMINSSIAAGAGERAAIESAMPLVGEAMGLTRQREQLGFQGQENALNRIQGVNNALLGSQIQERSAMLDSQLRRQLQRDSAIQQDWLGDRSFTRQFNGVLSMMPINSAFQLNNLIQQYALDNPEVYTPQVISGMSNFFNRNMLSILQTYFPDMAGGS